MSKKPPPKRTRIEDVLMPTKVNRSLMESMLSQVVASRTSFAVDEAQEIMFDAWEAADHRRRIALAKKALAISRDCADAYVLLAQESTPSAEAALKMYQRGVAAGERALGKKAFKEDVGMFWGLIETRPYMRARHGLALSQWECGQRESAVANVEDMLRLNPNDNQGVRYLLLDWLLRMDRDGDAAKVFERYRGDGSTEVLWPAALAAFRRVGDAPASRRALQRARAVNPHVGDYLTGAKKLPHTIPELVGFGSQEEAAAHVELAFETWAQTAEALDWLRQRLTAARSGRPAGRAARRAARKKPTRPSDRQV
ncbi:MAG TPA: hypothetical protein VGS12_18450 [Caulobacteraceae bacterium]|nr:hypothetical protein [Caulobacteraceae bacterium]